MLDNCIEGDAHFKTPFRVGFPLPGCRFIHVLDEMTVDVMVKELDTVPTSLPTLSARRLISVVQA
jgi:hypothetical protein